jgi:hypothetical protein
MPPSVPADLPRRCPRCRNALTMARDWAGAYSSCLICGYVYEWGAAPAATPVAAVPTDGATPRPRRLRAPSHGTRSL